MTKTTFSWKNYTRPTPRNLLGLSAAVRRLFTVITASTIFAGADQYVSLTVLAIGATLDEFKNFFATVVEDTKTESAVAEFPSGEEVIVTKEVKPDAEEA